MPLLSGGYELEEVAREIARRREIVYPLFL